ncbi:MAG: hypothetical protein KBF76_13520 [Verrucomicrobiales bacterium]|nr:hypothetical protein [Verrucomicrobiales bacterium]
MLYAFGAEAFILEFQGTGPTNLGLLMLYAFGAEAFISFYGANKFEGDAGELGMFGPYSAFAVYVLNLIAVLSTQIFWIPRLRRSAAACLVVGILNLFP